MGVGCEPGDGACSPGGGLLFWGAPAVGGGNQNPEGARQREAEGRRRRAQGPSPEPTPHAQGGNDAREAVHLGRADGRGCVPLPAAPWGYVGIKERSDARHGKRDSASSSHVAFALPRDQSPRTSAAKHGKDKGGASWRGRRAEESGP